jgi:hypothetical protein
MTVAVSLVLFIVELLPDSCPTEWNSVEPDSWHSSAMLAGLQRINTAQSA